MEGFPAKAMVELSVDDEGGGYAAQESLAEAQGGDDGAALLPPTPLLSLIRLSSSSAGGVLLTGYDDTFVAGSLYHSHLDSASPGFQAINKDAIASAATLLARTAVASAYRRGGGRQHRGADWDAQPSAPPHSYYTSRGGRGSRGGTPGWNASTAPGRRTSCGGSGASTGTGARSSCGAWPAGRSWDGGGGGGVRAPRLGRLGQRQRQRRGLLGGGFGVGGGGWPERRGIDESAVVWWPPRSDDIQGGRSARRGGSVVMVRAVSAATRDRGACEAQARSGRGALGLGGTGKEELPER